MDNNEIKRTNRKALPKFILLFVVCALIGGVIGYFSGKYALNELTGSIKAAGAFFGTRIAPWLMLALAVIVPAVCVPIYRSAKKLIGMWDGEDEELADIIDGRYQLRCGYPAPRWSSPIFSLLRRTLRALPRLTAGRAHMRFLPA